MWRKKTLSYDFVFLKKCFSGLRRFKKKYRKFGHEEKKISTIPRVISGWSPEKKWYLKRIFMTYQAGWCVFSNALYSFVNSHGQKHTCTISKGGVRECAIRCYHAELDITWAHWWKKRQPFRVVFVRRSFAVFFFSLRKKKCTLPPRGSLGRTRIPIRGIKRLDIVECPFLMR